MLTIAPDMAAFINVHDERRLDLQILLQHIEELVDSLGSKHSEPDLFLHISFEGANIGVPLLEAVNPMFAKWL